MVCWSSSDCWRLSKSTSQCIHEQYQDLFVQLMDYENPKDVKGWLTIPFQIISQPSLWFRVEKNHYQGWRNHVKSCEMVGGLARKYKHLGPCHQPTDGLHFGEEPKPLRDWGPWKRTRTTLKIYSPGTTDDGYPATMALLNVPKWSTQFDLKLKDGYLLEHDQEGHFGSFQASWAHSEGYLQKENSLLCQFLHIYSSIYSMCVCHILSPGS